MKITIHRGSSEIGGTCIQLSTEQSTILLDLGLPLRKDSKELDVAALKPDAVLISHPHQDHFGLIEALEHDIPVYMGELSKNLINATRMLLGIGLLKNEIHYFKAWQSFVIGDFTITPYLMDHSAVDAYGFLIEAEEKRIFYSGDFRAHGRKSILFNKIIKNPPKDIDLLFMEGTMIQRKNDDFPTEADVEKKIYETIKEQVNITFLISSSQNIDRIVSAFRACLRTGKTLVLDIYTAWVLEKLKLVSHNIPAMEWDQIKIKLSYSQHEKLKDNPDFFGDFRNRVYQQRISKEEMQANPSNYLYFSKMSHFRTINFYKEIKPVNVIYSQWLGYLTYKDEDYFGAEAMAGYRNDPQVNFVYAHTSGHATVEVLKKFAEALKPKMLVPVHTEHGDEFKTLFNNVTEIHDNEIIELGPMEGKMYYDRAISPELESKFKKYFNWLYDFVKKREDLDFLIGANKSIEWVSVYRGTSRIIRVVKGKTPDSIIKIDGAEAYMTLAGSLKTDIYTDGLDNFSKFEGHLMTLLDRVSDDKKYDRYYNNKKEGYYQNILSRKYGINSLPESDFVIIDKEVVIGYKDKNEKEDIFGGKQKKYRDLLEKISLLDPIKFGKGLEKKAIGNELDFLAWKSDGTLLLIELKHGTNTSGIYLSPLQIGLYAEIFEHYKEKNEADFYNSLKRMVEQKQRMGLIHKDWKIPAEITSIKPMLIISEYNPKSTGREKFCEILAISRELFGETFLRDIEVRSYRCQQDKSELIFTDIDNARQLFREAGFDLPTIPDVLAKQIKQREEWLFSTRAIPKSPNFSSFYVDEVSNNTVGDYALISYSRNGRSWMAIHYYLVFGPLRMFLELGRGGMYTDDEGDAIQVAKIRECFLLADKIIPATMAMCKANDRLTIFCSDFHGSYWVAPSEDAQKIERRCHCPKDVLSEVLQWLGSSVGDGMNFMEYVLKLAEEMDGKEREEFLAMAEQIDREEDEFEQRKIIYLSDYRKRLDKK